MPLDASRSEPSAMTSFMSSVIPEDEVDTRYKDLPISRLKHLSMMKNLADEGSK